MLLYLKFLDSNPANREPLAFYRFGRQAACLHTPHCSPCRSASVRAEPYLELEWGEDFACRGGDGRIMGLNTCLFGLYKSMLAFEGCFKQRSNGSKTRAGKHGRHAAMSKSLAGVAYSAVRAVQQVGQEGGKIRRKIRQIALPLWFRAHAGVLAWLAWHILQGAQWSSA